MSNCDCQKNIKKTIEDGLITSVDTMGAKKRVGDGLFINTVTVTVARILLALRVVSVRQRGALLASTSLVYLMSFPVW